MLLAGLQYNHTPVRYTPGSSRYVYSRTDVNFYLSSWMNAAEGRNVVVHCYTGYKAVQVALIGAGRQYGLNSEWAVRRARELGYHYDTQSGQPVVKLLRAVLG
ncbi:hypothetical protein LSAT2_020987 [Lamellibrachia satsuma]|nr:hypothetical protein LSAT2_020987 [Lamellibrachia satsuma]